MEEKKKVDKSDIYVLVLTGLFYLYIYGINITKAALETTGWDWIPFIVFALIALFLCALAWGLSVAMVGETIKYFGLSKNYLVLTILSIIIAPLTIVFLLLLLSGVIPSIFDPSFL